MARGKPPSRPVREAFWLVTGSFVLLAAQTLATLFLLVRFGAAYDAHGPWTFSEQAQADSLHAGLVGAAILGAGMSMLLAGAALAVPRRSTRTRTVVGCAAVVLAGALLLGIVVGPDGAVLAGDAGELAHLEMLLPVWFTALASSTVTAVIVLLGVAFARLGRDAALDYYQHHDPTATWRGFISWLNIASRR
ncbi:hypothetical protein ACFO1B_47840 [Dactylosporangium siamense]|uniref:hypothetical protein n=1 Tax=Dactylosporangium siamense TaxID=685454 RepID=UPI001943708D|nr:hypothetical protein [Dactylosporangium siamense]